MKSVKEIINIIKQILMVTNEDYASKGLMDDEAMISYMNGKCYYFAVILKDILGYGDLMISKSGNHIALKVGDNVYDALGLTNSDDFNLVEEQDWLNIEVGLMDDKINEEANNEFMQNIVQRVKALENNEERGKSI